MTEPAEKKRYTIAEYLAMEEASPAEKMCRKRNF